MRFACWHGHEAGRALFELLPDVFPQRTMTELEAEVWAVFYADLDAKRKESSAAAKTKAKSRRR